MDQHAHYRKTGDRVQMAQTEIQALLEHHFKARASPRTHVAQQLRNALYISQTCLTYIEEPSRERESVWLPKQNDLRNFLMSEECAGMAQLVTNLV